MLFKLSKRIRAGMQTFPLSFDSISIWIRITVSRSVATTLSLFFSTSNKKSSRIGNTVLALITPEICCSCFNKAEEETINFILQLVCGEANDFWIIDKNCKNLVDIDQGRLLALKFEDIK